MHILVQRVQLRMASVMLSGNLQNSKNRNKQTKKKQMEDLKKKKHRMQANRCSTAPPPAPRDALQQ